MSIDERICYTVQATFSKETENPAIVEVCDCFHLFSKYKETISSWQQIDIMWMPCCRSTRGPGCCTTICVYCYRMLHVQVPLVTSNWLVMQSYLCTSSTVLTYSTSSSNFLLHNSIRISTRTGDRGPRSGSGIQSDPLSES